uniref:Uncharacterized protein n=1 Tax=Anguilla anguilla TaxID=7936 RepID=A0A0E9ST60_ANGAN
MEGDECVCK